MYSTTNMSADHTGSSATTGVSIGDTYATVAVGVEVEVAVSSGVGVAVSVGVEVEVAVSSGVGVAVSVGVEVEVAVSSGVGVAVSVGVEVEVAVSSGVGVAVSVGVEVEVAVSSGVGVAVSVGVEVEVAVSSGVGVAGVYLCSRKRHCRRRWDDAHRNRLTVLPINVHVIPLKAALPGTPCRKWQHEIANCAASSPRHLERPRQMPGEDHDPGCRTKATLSEDPRCHRRWRRGRRWPAPMEALVYSTTNIVRRPHWLFPWRLWSRLATQM